MKRTIFISFILVVILAWVPVSAESNDSQDGEILDFNIDTVEHSGQLNKNVGYFHLSIGEDLLNNPLQIELFNNSDQEEEYSVVFHTARTNENGLIVYDDYSYGPNDTLKHNLEEYVNINEPLITIGPKSSKVIEVKIDTESLNDVNGILVGALRIYKTKDYTQDVGIGNRFAYQLGVVLNSNVSGALPNSEFLELNKDSVKLSLNANRKVIEYEIDNLESQIARNLSINTKLINKKTDQVILKRNLESASIAPNGTLPGLLDWERYDVEPGDYNLQINIADGNKQWTWNHDITITKEEAKEVNELSTYSVMLPKFSLWLLPLLAIATVFNHYQLMNRKED